MKEIKKKINIEAEICVDWIFDNNKKHELCSDECPHYSSYYRWNDSYCELYKTLLKFLCLGLCLRDKQCIKDFGV